MRIPSSRPHVPGSPRFRSGDLVRVLRRVSSVPAGGEDMSSPRHARGAELKAGDVVIVQGSAGLLPGWLRGSVAPWHETMFLRNLTFYETMFLKNFTQDLPQALSQPLPQVLPQALPQASKS